VSSRLPTVSIGLPVRNGERYLRAALDDFLAQTFDDWELIISDNASTDSTEEIARDFAARDDRIRYQRNEIDIGALPNANWTIALASGRYFALAAYDDRHASDFLERLVAALDGDHGAVLAYGRCQRIDEHDQPLAYDDLQRAWVDATGRAYPGDMGLERTLADDSVARYRAVLASASVDAPVHGLFRLGELRRAGGHVVYGSDRLLVARAALAGRFVFVDAPLFRFRIHPGSTLHLDEATRLERESPGADVGRRSSKTLRNYLAAVAGADLRPSARARAMAATAGYAMRRALSPPSAPVASRAA
jgi:glycosyltransferase involved in cell wall biosynthesis